jgi:general secretion pathway protein G
MVVVIILAILAGTVVQQFGGTAHDTRVSRAQADIKNFEGALERYFLKMDRYPSSEEGLEALVRPPTESGRNWGGPYVREIVPDPWNHPYRYRSPGSRPERPYELWSCGADGVDGGEGVNQDIKNWREDY